MAPILLLALLGISGVARADVLVTRAGGRVETKGGWQVKGKLVVFTQADGTLSSLRLADVDLPASAKATTEAKTKQEKPPEPAKPERRKSVASLTDADFSHKSAEGAAADKPEAAKEAKDAKDADKEKKSAPEAAKSPVEVSSWRQADRTEGDGLDLVGELKNSDKELATNITLKVELFNETNQSLGKADAVLAASSIRGGDTISFRVPFPGVFTFSRASFAVNSRMVTLDDAGKKGEKPAADRPPGR